MASKTYTAKQMRDAALFAETVEVPDQFHGQVLDGIAAMLRQAADAMESEGNKCGDCAKFGSDCSAGDVDGNEDCRACKQFVSKEVSALRALVKELVGCFENWVEKYPPSEWSRMGQSWQLLEETVTRAKEVVK